jgi:hypothetical protein
MKEIFTKAVNTIENREKRDFMFYLTGLIPSYFWTVPASSSGKYHPITDLGEGGLVRHSLMVYRIALDLLESKQNTTIDRDDVIIAALMHDCCKQGYRESGKTCLLHPIYASELIRGLAEVYFDEIPLYIDRIISAIATHMGKWNTSKYEEGELPTPKTEFEMLLHEADYIASRKYVLYDNNYFDKL